MLNGVIICIASVSRVHHGLHQGTCCDAVVRLTSRAQPAVVRKDSVTYDLVTMGSYEIRKLGLVTVGVVLSGNGA
jgi:hypothetical protein